MRTHLKVEHFVPRAVWIGVMLAFFLLSLSSKPTHAQEYPRWEAFTGFSYAHVNLGQQTSVFQPADQNYYGMHFNGSFNPRRYLRIILCDFAVQLGGTTTKVSPLNADLRTSQVLFGTEFVRRSDKTALFAHTLFGLSNTRLVESLGGSDIVPDVASRTNLAFGVGGGFDIHLTRLLAVRAVQADYVPTRLAGTWENQFRVSTGVVFTFNYQGSAGSRR
jgi:hypothetical protein